MKNHGLLFLLIILCASFPIAANAGAVCIDPVNTLQGDIIGVYDGNQEACVWKGIPFAQPPVGELRLRAPVSPLQSAVPFEAFEYGPACMQKETLTSGGESPAGFSEDCLYLNIWSPKKSGRFPVMVWIHGGGFTQGSGAYEMYGGARLSAGKDVVVITINYRLGPFGYMALPELKEEDENGYVGNYGTLDQIKALEWVRDNIEGFGGDPDNVTVFGQSAGGMSICALLVAKPAERLFHRAIDMSGPCRLMSKLEDGYEKGKTHAEALGCSGPEILDCLRRTPAKELLNGHENALFSLGVSYAPTVDGELLVDMPVKLIQRGEYYKVPVMMGSTKDELRIYTMMLPGMGLQPKANVNYLLRKLTDPNYDDIMAMYDYKDYRRPVDLALAFGNQMVFDAPAYMMAKAMQDKNPVYLYRFDWNDTRFPNKMGAMHGLDIPLVFGALDLDSRLSKLIANKKAFESGGPLSENMMSYFANFAKTGDPNGEGLMIWPAYDTETKKRIYFDSQTTIKSLTELEIKRYEYFAEKELDEVLQGTFVTKKK